ncbi:MAG: nucleoside phosphorylase [Flavobacteriales bacterium]|nr:nucleoside phosphorylase [Flavobacteriales bacterium]MBK6551593.1 nucleoside phosphorylase [Flavobacteriales bacterium]MBK6882121.1 nucleoside phosphorylase [Flavobacteriales bacterium]MBK7101660.1 nucleoside phosphorylase [Flavobacteriales bacterium]MBK7112367.1 nucleoside phosphorylase [Flavobacteriales bacterium]
MHAITLTPPGTIIAPSELILNPDGSVYHIALRPEQLGDLVLVVGDQNRVELISRHFSKIEHKVQNREFVAHTGEYSGTHITVLSTGIGTDNIDIVVNELDALVNIDLEARTPKTKSTSLRIIRLGTCGALQEDIPVDSRIVSAFGVGLDNVLHYYAYENTDAEDRLLNEFLAQTEWPDNLPVPYVAAGDAELVARLGHENVVGITLTSGGFYAPQGRQLRGVPSVDGLNERFTAFAHEGLRATNFEMETSALFGLGGMLGHRVCTVCTVVANRLRKEYSKDHHAAIDRMIEEVLERATA